ncbi:MAG: DNA primase [Flavobacterium sp. MedPE-SWcel]|uniref:DNA primase family protein n=1 Tax=uncultured Flavobacterium sp. TaxID=165435 RepID=UPI00091BFD9D|nr:phage/plasmid primase, P4 family [uncultured Flavobacterium sp.]OIQ16609.1 MAG: DNA primase [Flavobacterium sp. MedPE-SWcel]
MKTNLNPNFDDLQQPETFLNHVNQLTQPPTTAHDEILSQLLEQFKPLDFEALANIKKVENFRLTSKHYTVLSIENILEVAKEKNWGLCKKHDSIYLFNGAYWSKLDKEIFQSFLGCTAKKMGVPLFDSKYFAFKEKLYKQFLSAAQLDIKPSQVNKVVINLQNGTFEITPKIKLLRPFDPLDFLTYQLPFEYNTEAKAPTFEAYLNKVLPDVDCQKVLAEYIGYIFIKNGSKTLKEEKALILYGTGANGKSVFFEIVNALLGEENTSNYSLQSLTDSNGYYRASIANKLVNYASEINGKHDTNLFKQMVSGEPIEARLPHGNPHILKQYAKFIFNCNELPQDVEQTNAYFRRFLIIPFNVTIPENEQDKTLHTKIIESELSGVFNWVLDGLNRLLKQQRFTNCEAAQQALKEYKLQSDSVKMFIKENNYQKSPTDYKLIQELYIEYKTFCIDDGYKALGKVQFNKRLSSTGVEVKRMGVGNVAYLTKNID